MLWSTIWTANFWRKRAELIYRLTAAAARVILEGAEDDVQGKKFGWNWALIGGGVRKNSWTHVKWFFWAFFPHLWWRCIIFIATRLCNANQLIMGMIIIGPITSFYCSVAWTSCEILLYWRMWNWRGEDWNWAGSSWNIWSAFVLPSEIYSLQQKKSFYIALVQCSKNGLSTAQL